MKKLKEWLCKSNRWKHLTGGMIIGFFAFGWFTAIYAGTLTAAALEFKDKAYGWKWDWTDLGLTLAGAVVGNAARVMMEAWMG